jgi:phosphoribosylaminoimidazolecarboxamide formyltransferase/IMP cyclohydrolase
MRIAIKRALISVSDKTGLLALAQGLHQAGVQLLSTGGTAAALAQAGIAVTEVASVTGMAEMLDGRVKTLHPAIHGAILARRDDPAHMAALQAAGITPIDLVVVNLYPFRQTVARAGCTLQEAIENIDIGGPTMVRAAAKNHAGVAIVTDPADYPALLQALRTNDGTPDGTPDGTSGEMRLALAKKAFAHTAAYDNAIANYLTGLNDQGQAQPQALFPQVFPQVLGLQFHKLQDMRYGENPHQSAAFYRDEQGDTGGIASARQLQGKELSFNNIADADTAWECVRSFATTQPACVIVKHANPCGVALGDSARSAYERAFATDPTSAFGGIIAFNVTVDAAAAEVLVQQFMEVLIAPGYSDEALRILAGKPNIRVLVQALLAVQDSSPALDYKRVGGGLLVQTPDANVSANDQLPVTDSHGLRIVSRRQPDAAQSRDLAFAWQVARFVKSNAIVFCRDGRTLGVGAGQMSRVDSARIAGIKAANAGLDLQGSVVASDAFFPFRDGVDVVVAAGARAIVQPGGSVRDAEVIAAADEQDVAMAFTGVRHFRH